MNAYTEKKGYHHDMPLAPYILPGAWALGEGLDLAMPLPLAQDTPSTFCDAARPGVWSSICDTVSVALDMVGWEWEYRQTYARKCSPAGSCRSSNCGTEKLEVDFSDSEDGEASDAVPASQLGWRRPEKPCCHKQD